MKMSDYALYECQIDKSVITWKVWKDERIDWFTLDATSACIHHRKTNKWTWTERFSISK